jgi:hypothetical protein
MQKFQVAHWMGTKPPHPRAVQEDDGYTFQLTMEGLMTLAKDYDLMIQHKHGTSPPILWLDDKGRKFRQR